MTTETKDTLIDINGFAVKIALSFAAKNDVRYYLNGINVRPLAAGGAMIAATDGYKLIVIRDPNGTATGEITVKITDDTARHLKQETRMQVYTDGQLNIIDKHDLTKSIQVDNAIIDGKFPNLEPVLTIDNYQEGITGSFDTAILSAVANLTKTAPLEIKFFTNPAANGTGPTAFQAGTLRYHPDLSELQIIGVFMPVRSAIESLPDWLPWQQKQIEETPPTKPRRASKKTPTKSPEA